MRILQNKISLKSHPIILWFLSGIILGLYVSFWLNRLNNLFPTPFDAGLLTIYLVVISAGIAGIVGVLVHFILFDLNHLSLVKLTPEKKYIFHQRICLTLLFYLPTRFGCQIVFGYPSGLYKIFCDLFYIIIIAFISWYIVAWYNSFRQKLSHKMIYVFYFVVLGISLGLFSFFWSESRYNLPASPETSAIRFPKNNQKIIVIGIDSADWKVVNSLIRQNKLPHLTHLIKAGVSGKLTTMKPTLSPLLWTSIATGKLPDKHGVYSFLYLTIPGIRTPIYYHDVANQYMPRDYYIDSLGIKWIRELLLKLNVIQSIPVSARNIRTSTIWEILNDNNRTVGVLGWWPSWPVNTALNGFMVVEKMTSYIRPHSIHPAYLEDTIQHLAKKPEQVKLQDIQQFIALDSVTFNLLRNPQYAPDFQAAIKAIKRYFIEDDFYFNTGKYLYQKFHPSFFAIYFHGLDKTQHGFWHTFEPEKFPALPQEALRSDVAKYGKVIENYYIYNDKLIGELLKQAEPETAIIILSDHGMEASGSLPIPGTHEHAPPGIIVLSGPPFRKNYQITGASVLDITPTILAISGFPVAKDMDGKILKDAFTPDYLAKLNLSSAIVSYDGIKKKLIKSSPTPYDEEIKEQLRSLGYIQ
jgi:predicted AlkP superfamily phosphohydrolase/phosphomutase